MIDSAKTRTLGEVVETVIEEYGIEDVLNIMEDTTRERGYPKTADWLKTAREQFEVEDEEQL